MQLSQEKAAEAYLARKAIRASLAKWAEHCGFIPARHHRMLIEYLEKVAKGEIMRLAVFMPPGSAKSTYASILFPSWLLSQDPKAQFLAASHTTELAERWGRRVRNLVMENAAILRINMSEEQAVGRWGLAEGGEYMAAGANVGIAGFRAKYGLIDDPIRSRQDADSVLVRDRIWDWYLNDFRPRLIPHARQVLIQCMTGDTMVLMANGTEKPLREVRRNDVVATRKDGALSISVVRNWASNGLDNIFTIKTTSGITAKANARHPFLVCEGGRPKWIKTSDLRPGHEIVRVNGANGKERLARRVAAIFRLPPEAIVPRITTRSGGVTAFALPPSILRRVVSRISSTVTELMAKTISVFTFSRTASAPYADSLPGAMSAHTGAASSASITAMTPMKSEGFFATIATSLSGTQKARKFLSPPPNTSDFTLDKVVEIKSTGVEEVFDVQIDGTQNFIANGLVSHNTRWHEDDLAGRCLNHQHWDVLSLPAFAKSDDQLGRTLDEPLWADDDYGYGDQLRSLRDTTPPRIWSALYQQEPTPDEGDYFKEDWLKPVDILPSLSTMRTYGASDYAVTGDGGDYTVHVVFGVDPLNNLYLLDVWRGQKTSDIWVDALCDLVAKYRPLAWAEEGGQIRAGIGPFLDRQMRMRRVYVNREQFPTRGDKSIRARSIQGRMALDGLYYPKRAPWVADWLAELLNFPASKHDDQCDAMGLCGQLLDQMVKGRAGVAPKLTLPKDGYKSSRDRIKTVDAMTL